MKNALSIRELVIGKSYPVSALSSTKQASECPCCKRALSAHRTVVCVFAADQKPQDCKAVVGQGCSPAESVAPSRVVTLKITARREASAAEATIMWATRKMDYRTLDREGHGSTYIVGLGIPEDKGCQQVAKVAKSLSEVSATITQSLDGGKTWEPLDTTTWSKRLGCGKYQGLQVYGV